MASTEKAVTLWLYRVFFFLLVAVVIDIQGNEIRRKTLTFHSSLQKSSTNTREIVMPAEAFDEELALDFSIKSSLPEKYEIEGGRIKRQTSSPAQSAVRGFLPALPANSTSVVSRYCFMNPT